MKMYSLAVTPNGHLEGKGSMPPPIIMHTAATPMPTPKGSPHMDSAYPFGDSRRGSNVSVDPLSFDQKSLVFSQEMAGQGRVGKGKLLFVWGMWVLGRRWRRNLQPGNPAASLS